MRKKYYLVLISLILIAYPSAVSAEDTDKDLSDNIETDTDTETLDINYNQDQLGDDKSISNDEEEKELTESDKPTDKELIEKKDEEILEEKDDSVLDVEYIEKRAVTNSSTKSNANEEEVDKSFNLSPEEIINLKNDLNKLGFFVTMNYPSSYGPKTTAAVKEFQEYYGLEANGLADEKTLQRLEEALKNSLKRNDNSIEIRELKENLNLLGFSVGMNYPNNYGPATEQAVKLFQRSYGLRESGVADEFTLAKIDKLLKESLKPGDNSKQVRLLKENLNVLTYFVTMNYPNNYGPATTEAVKKFQSNNGIYPTGVADPKTLDKINEHINSPLSLGIRRVDVLELKEKLNKIGFHVSNNPTYYYGPVTEKVIKEFQSYYKLNVNGKADEETLSMLDQILTNSLKRNDNSSKVKKLKENLNSLGFKVGMNYPNNYGPATEKAVKAFQVYYDLRVTGVADKYVLEKIDELLKNALKRDDNSPKVYQLKKDLNKLGFSVSTNYPNNFGPATERAVKQFQSYYGLLSNGIANDVTLNKLKELLDNSFWESQRHSEIKKLKENLNKLGFSVSMNYPDRFGPATKKAIEKFQKHFGLKVTGVAEEKTLKKIDEILNSPLRKGKNSSAVRQLKEKLNDIGFSVTMNYPDNFGPATERAVKAFQKAYNLPVSGIVDDITLARINREHRNLIKIFIDPGHGGRDPGASGYHLREKDVVLDIARAIRDHLEKNYVGISIKMSRSNDKYLSLDQRTNMANKWGADFFLSIHSNAGGGRGFESYVHNNASREAIKKQSIIHDYIIKEMGWRDRGKKKANFHVLRESNMSALLLEVLFIDNKQDNNQLKNKSYRKKIGQTIAEAIAKAFNLKRK